LNLPKNSDTHQSNQSKDCEEKRKKEKEDIFNKMQQIKIANGVKMKSKTKINRNSIITHSQYVTKFKNTLFY